MPAPSLIPTFSVFTPALPSVVSVPPASVPKAHALLREPDHLRARPPTSQTTRIVTLLLNRCNTIVLIKKTEIFSTCSSNQPGTLIQVYNAERVRMKDNLFSKFELSGIPPASYDVLQIEVTFVMDANGVLNVFAADKMTGKSNRVTTVNSKGGLSKEIEHMLSEAEKHETKNVMATEYISSKNGLESSAYNPRNSLVDELESAVNDAISWLGSFQEVSLEAVVNPIMRKLCQARRASSPVVRLAASTAVRLVASPAALRSARRTRASKRSTKRLVARFPGARCMRIVGVR